MLEGQPEDLPASPLQIEYPATPPALTNGKFVKVGVRRNSTTTCPSTLNTSAPVASTATSTRWVANVPNA